MFTPESLRRPRQGSLLSVIAWALVTLVSLGDSDSFAQPSSSAGQSNESNGDTPAEPNAAADDSLTIEEYLRLGLAAPDREWSGDDMANAEKILRSLVQKGYKHLPRYKSERSGEVFSRLTSPQNLNLCKDRTFPLEARLPQLLKYYQASNEVFKLYLAAFLKEEAQDRELVELIGAQCRSTVVLLDLVDELLPTIKKSDPKYQARMQGIDQMRRGLALFVAGGLQTLTERDSHRTSELGRLVGYMQETYPQIVPRLTPAGRTETLVRLEKMQQDPALKDLHAGLKVLLAKVTAAVEQEAAPKPDAAPEGM